MEMPLLVHHCKVLGDLFHLLFQFILQSSVGLLIHSYIESGQEIVLDDEGNVAMSSCRAAVSVLRKNLAW